MWLARVLKNDLLLFAVFGLAYLVSYEISVNFDLVDSFAPGISLIFIPAGVKLVAALVAGFWGVFGTVVALAFVAKEIWVDQPAWFYMAYAAISGFTTLIAVEVMKKLLKLNENLTNLRLMHLPLIDLASTLSHGFVVNGFFVSYGLPIGTDFLLRATAMAVGDFVGGMILLVGFAIVFNSIKSVFGNRSLNH